MGGNKKNGKPKGLTPAKRKEAVQKSLKDRVKNDNDIKELIITIEKTEKERIVLEQEREHLNKWADQRDSLFDEVDSLSKKNSDRMGTTGHEGSKVANKHCVQLKQGEVRERVWALERFQRQLRKKKSTSDDGFKKMSNAFLNLLDKYKVTRDQIKLLQIGSGSQRQILTDRKETLEKKIKNLQLVYSNMSVLDQQRQKEQGDLTLEDFMDGKIKGVQMKIEVLKTNISHVNEELTRVTNLVSERQQKVHDLKVAIKSKSLATVEESEEYQKVVQTNKHLLSQLDDLLAKRSQIAEETGRVTGLIDEDKRGKMVMTDEELKINNAIATLEQQYESSVQREPADQEITDELRKQIWARDVSLAQLQSATKQLRKSVSSERQTVANLKRDIANINQHNTIMLEALSASSDGPKDGAVMREESPGK